MSVSYTHLPTIEKELPMTKDQAFQRVYEGAQKGCSYCAYAIANVYQWGDYHILPSAQKVANEGEPSFFVRFLKGLFAQADQRRFANKVTAIAQQWLRKSAEAGLVIAYRNLRITYIEQNLSLIHIYRNRWPSVLRARHGPPLRRINQENRLTHGILLM